MVVCQTCGYKRCPKASDHRLNCTGSNAPGQPGSVYGSADHEPGNGVVATPAEKRPSGPKFKSKAEARYAQLLEARKRAGEIADWDYEALTLVVGRAESMVSRLTPDFVVHQHDGAIELHEVKGWLRDDARAKLLAAVRQWPGFAWWLVWARKGFEPERLA